MIVIHSTANDIARNRARKVGRVYGFAAQETTRACERIVENAQFPSFPPEDWE